MRKRQPEALDMVQILEAAHREIEDRNSPHQGLWQEILLQTFGPHISKRPKDKWYWSASALSGCIRQQIYSRAGLAGDGFTIDAQNTMAIGNLYHAYIQFGVQILPQYCVLGVEIGGYHPTLPLGARADIIHQLATAREGSGYLEPWFIDDIKSEHSYKGNRRRAHQKATGASHAGDPGHVIQLAATAMVVEETRDIEPFELGWLIYIDKSHGKPDQQLVPIEASARQAVKDRIEQLEEAWEVFEKSGFLPARLDQNNPDVAWACRVRDKDDQRGLYCPARSTCWA